MTLSNSNASFVISSITLLYAAHAFAFSPASSTPSHLLQRQRLLPESSLIFSSSPRCSAPLYAMKDANGPLNMIPSSNSELTSRTEKIDASSQAIDGEASTVPYDFGTMDEEDDDSKQLSIWAARALLLTVAILWGTNFASVKYLENLCFHPPCVHPPSEAALARFGVAGLVSIPFLVNRRKDIILAGFECGLWITLGYVTQALALSTISAGKCAFICSLTVVVVPLIEGLFFGKPVRTVNLISGALAIAGVGILEGMVDFHQLLAVQPAIADATTTAPALADTTSTAVASASTVSSSIISNVADSGSSSTSWLANIEATLGISKGDLMALGQPFGFGIAFMRIEHYVEKFKEDKNRIMTLSAAQCLIVGILSFFWVLIDFHGHVPNMQYMIEPHRLGAIAWTGIMTTVVAIYLEGFALQVLSATEAALTFASEPVWATLFGSWLLHETMNVNSYVGGAVILGACILSAVVPGDTDSAEQIEGGTEM